MATRTALAPAKVNLFLHVGPVDAAGWHPLASLVAFADIGDRLTVEAADRLLLTVEGPFAPELAGQDDNLILRALRALGAAAGTGEPPLAVTLDKRLPIAAGLGGGSSDAGAALKLARDRLDLPLTDDALADIAAARDFLAPRGRGAASSFAEAGGVLASPVLMSKQAPCNGHSIRSPSI